jgi:RNA polymerase sigma-70 factor (ECF subfamily)
MSTLEFNRLLVEYQNPLSFFALKLTSDEEDAKDLLQETYLKAMTYRDKLVTRASVKGWLYTIMKNTFINQYRRGVKLGEIKTKFTKQSYVSTASSEIAITPDRKMSADQLRAAIAALRDEYRIPFEMKLDGYKYEEIGDHMGIPVGTVKSRIFLARQQLTRMLPEYKKDRAN